MSTKRLLDFHFSNYSSLALATFLTVGFEGHCCLSKKNCHLANRLSVANETLTTVVNPPLPTIVYFLWSNILTVTP